MKNTKDKVKDKQYIKYIFKVRVPQRFFELLIPEIIISSILFALIQMYVITVYSYVPSLWITTFIYWFLTYLMAEIDARNASKLKYYYLCKVTAFFLFLLVSLILYFYDYFFTEKSLVSTLHFILFRISYAYGLSGDRAIYAGETVTSFIFFYGITLLIILFAPFIRKLRKKLSNKRNKWEEKAKLKYKNKENKSTNHNHDDRNKDSHSSNSSHHHHHSHHSHHHHSHHNDNENANDVDTNVEDVNSKQNI